MSLFFVSFPLMAVCTKTGGALTVGVSLQKLRADAFTAPAGTVLSAETFGGNFKGTATFKGCAVNDLYAVTAVPSVVEAIGVRGVSGGKVYETGIPGIGFEFTDYLTGSASRPIPAAVGTSYSAYGLNSTSKPELMTIWFIKTKDNIEASSLSGGRTVTEIVFTAGIPGLITAKTDLFYLQIKIGSSIAIREGSCEITPQGGSTVNLQPIDLTLLKGISQGAVTGKQKEFTLDVTCPDSSVGFDYRYWFNPISDVSATKNGVLLNSTSELSGGAKNVGLIIKQGTTPITFFDASKYTITKVSKSQSLSFTADYYKVSNDVSTGSVSGMMEIVIQEK